MIAALQSAPLGPGMANQSEAVIDVAVATLTFAMLTAAGMHLRSDDLERLAGRRAARAFAPLPPLGRPRD